MHKSTIGFLIGLAIIMGAIFRQSYNGRADVVNAQRHACLLYDAHVLVPQLNVVRADQIGNQTIASDPRQPARTRAALSAEVALEARSLRYMDSRVDPRSTALLNPVGAAYIRQLQRAGRAFSCTKAYPAASPFQFFH